MDIAVRTHSPIADSTFRSFFLAALIAGWAVFAALAEDEAGPFPATAEKLLKQLQDRDAQFDNLLVEVEKSWTDSIHPQLEMADRQFKAWKWGTAAKEIPPIPKNLPEPYKQPHRVRHKLILRGNETTLHGGIELEKLMHPEFGYRIVPNLKATNASGVERSRDDGFDGKPSLRIHKRGYLSFLNSYRMTTEWALGYGFAKRMKAIDQYHVQGDLALCAGLIRIGDNDDCRCSLEIDRDLIVRRATVLIGFEGKARMMIGTQGTARPAGLPPVAQTGSYRRILNANGPVDKQTTEDDYKFKFVDAIGQLTDKTYADLVSIEPRAGTGSFTSMGTSRLRTGEPASTTLDAPQHATSPLGPLDGRIQQIRPRDRRN